MYGLVTTVITHRRLNTYKLHIVIIILVLQNFNKGGHDWVSTLHVTLYFAPYIELHKN